MNNPLIARPAAPFSGTPAGLAQPHVTIRGAAQLHDEGFELLVYWRTLLKHKQVILGLAGALAVLVTVIVFMMTPIYRATTTLLIEDNKAKVLSIEEVYNSLGESREQVQTQAEILKSQTVAQLVATHLKLVDNPLFDPRVNGGWFKNLRQSLGMSQKPTAVEIQDGVVKELMANLTIEPVRLSNLIKVSYDCADRELSAKIANAFAENFIENDLEAKFQMTQKANSWLNEHLAGLKDKLTQSEQALQIYREREHILDAKGLELSGSANQLEGLIKSQVESRMQLAETESAYREIKNAQASGTSLESLPVVLKDPVVGKLKEVVAEKAQKVSEYADRYGPKHIKMIQAQSELSQARDDLKRQVQQVVMGVEHEYDAARASANVVSGAVAEIKGNIQGANRKEFELTDLQRDVDTNKQVYDLFLQRFKETSASGDLTKAVARVVDPAAVPEIPARPRKVQLVGVALVLGLFLGVAVALMLERMDNTVRNTEEAELKLAQPILTTVPLLEGAGIERRYLDEPRSQFAEAIRTARTGVLLSAIDCPSKIMVVTSSVPGEGKTTLAANLALSQAQTKKVLLLDADLRRPNVARSLGLDPGLTGLSALVSGEANLEEVIQTVEGSTLHVLTAGSIPPNPLELLLSQRFKELLQSLSTRYDTIVIDSPPLQLVSDAVILSTLATGVVFVMKANSTPYQLARRSLRVLQNANVMLFGVVLNQLDFKKAEYHYGGYGGYGYARDGQGYYSREA